MAVVLPEHLLAAMVPGLPLPEGTTTAQAATAAVVGILAVSVISLLIGRMAARRNTPGGKIMRLAAGEAKILVPATFCLYANSALFMLIPYYGGQFVQMVGSKDGVTDEGLNSVTLHIVVVAVAYSLTSMIRALLFTLAGERIICKLRKQVFEALLRQEVAYFDEQTSGALVSRLTNDTSTLQNAASVNISEFLRSTASLCLSLMVMLATSWKLTLAMLGTVPVVSFLAVIMGQLTKRVSATYQKETAEMGKIAAETFGNLRTVRAFAHGEKMISGKYVAASDAVYRSGRQKSIIYGAWAGVVGMLFFVAFSIILRYGASLVSEGEMTSGALIAFVLYSISLSGSVAILGSLLPSFSAAVGATTKIFEMLDRIPAMKDGLLDPGSCNGLVEFDKVSFCYPTRTEMAVLAGVSFTAKPNQVLALVGPSGSGKSSCVSLLQRLYDVTNGSVRIDGNDVRELCFTFLRRHVAVVAQEPVLFAASARENILFGAQDASDSEVIEAAKLANCHEFISTFPEAYETLVGERGVQLSGGQKQRVAIARAIIAKPSILLLDEATSALDSESEGIVQQALNSLMEERKGRTFIVVAHRLSTVRSADVIVVLSGGCCAEIGTHDELLGKGGIYKDLVHRQLTESEQNRA